MTELERLMAIEEKVERLLAIEEIKRVKARYLRTLDQKDWDAFEAVFTPDASFDLREAIFARDKNTGEILKSGDVQIREEDIKDDEWLVTGAHNVRQWEQTYLTPIVTVHQAHMPEIELTSDSTARGFWHMEHILRSLRRRRRRSGGYRIPTASGTSYMASDSTTRPTSGSTDAG